MVELEKRPGTTKEAESRAHSKGSKAPPDYSRAEGSKQVEVYLQQKNQRVLQSNPMSCSGKTFYRVSALNPPWM